MSWFITILFVLFSQCSTGYGIDYQDEIDIFDLFEEVNGTFYELLDVAQDAKANEIRRAYRKLSLTLHPDKNKAEDAEEQFRRLVAVNDVLKDKEKRARYDDVLANGLPDWRQPIYYYRKYRKMGTLEMSLIVSVIATIGHFLTWIVAYYEKKFEMEEVLAPIRKRREKRRAKGKLTEEDIEQDLTTDELLEKELGYRKPTFWDLLPFVLCRGMYNFVTGIPTRIKNVKLHYEREKEQKKREEEELKEMEAEVTEKQVRPKKVKQPTKLRDASEFENEETCKDNSKNNEDINGTEQKTQMKKKAKWTEEDYAALAKAMGKFPGGTPGRWDRIALELGRRSDEITKKVKEMKTALVANVTTNTGGDQVVTKKKLAVNISDSIVTKAIDNELSKTKLITDSDLYQSQYDIPDDYDEGFDNTEEPDEDFVIIPKKTKVKTRPVDEQENKEKSESTENKEGEPESDANDTTNNTTTTKEVIIDSWSQVQQKCLEVAILQFPKSTSERWTCIARAVPEKTKEQCIVRYKLLAEHVKQKKQSKGS